MSALISEQYSPALQVFTSAFNAPSPEAAMRLACQQLLKQYSKGVPPIALQPLMKYLGVVSWNQSTEVNHSLLKVTPNGFEISIKKAQSWRRERFTWAHEIAHLLIIHTLKDPNLILSLGKDKATYDRVESICNLGAGEILMPTQFVKQTILEEGITPRNLYKLYDECLISKPVLFHRISQIIPTSKVISWGKFSRSTFDPLTMRVVKIYGNNSSTSNLDLWLPTDSTAKKHILPNIVSQAYDECKPIFCDELNITISGKTMKCIGIACPFPKRGGEQLPLFGKMIIQDDEEVGKRNPGIKPVDVILLYSPKNSAFNAKLWMKLKEHTLK